MCHQINQSIREVQEQNKRLDSENLLTDKPLTKSLSKHSSERQNLVKLEHNLIAYDLLLQFGGKSTTPTLTAATEYVLS